MVDVGEVAGAAAGFRAVVVVVAAVGFGFAAVEVALVRVEVRRDGAAPKVDVRRLSSSDTEEAGRWADEVAIEVRLVAVEVAVGRVGGLLSPPAAVPVRVDDVVGFVAVEDVAGRRAVVVVVVAGFFAAPTADLGPVAAAGFFTGAAAGAGDSGFSVGASTGASTGVSSATGGRDSVGEVSGGASSEGASWC